ncbi:MAG: hypothetical protein SNI70_04705 [Rikenellaceae bacterium]
MRKILYICLMAALVVGCKKDNAEIGYNSDEILPLEFSTNGTITRADGTEYETKEELQFSLITQSSTTGAPTASAAYYYDSAEDPSLTRVSDGLAANGNTYYLLIASPASEMVDMEGVTGYGYLVERETPFYISDPIALLCTGVATYKPNDEGVTEYYYETLLDDVSLKQKRSQVEFKFKSNLEDDPRTVNTLRVKDVYDKAYAYYLDETGVVFSPTYPNDGEINDWVGDGVLPKKFKLTAEYEAVIEDSPSYFISANYSASGIAYPTLVVGLENNGATKEVNIPLNIEMVPMYKYTYEINISSMELQVKVSAKKGWETIDVNGGEITEIKKFTVNIDTENIQWDNENDEIIVDNTVAEVVINEEFDFTNKNSNCFIINPEEGCNAYYIPISRIDDFWGNMDYSDQYYANAYTLNNLGDNWEAVMLWHDFSGSDNELISNVTFEQAVSSEAEEKCVKVVLPDGFDDPDNHCNICYVVRTKDTQTILWSWHLWITDYNPKGIIDGISSHSSEAAAYSLNGDTKNEVHRYQDNDLTDASSTLNVWSTIYKDKFIMDRNIGARSADFEGYGSLKNTYVTAPGALFYQWGRKDPFPIYGIYVNGYKAESVSGPISIIDAVFHPYRHVYNIGGNWCSDDNLQNDTYIWNDLSIPNSGYQSGKSLFDPSPQDFCVPQRGVYNDFTGGALNDEVSNNYTFEFFNSYTEIYATAPYDRIYRDIAYFPCPGYRAYDDSGYGAQGSAGYVWCASGTSNTGGAILRYYTTTVSNTNYYRSYSFEVRAIQE